MNIFKVIRNKFKRNKVKLSTAEIKDKIESLLAKDAVNIKLQLNYKILSILTLNSAIFESISDINELLAEKNISTTIDTSEIEKVVGIIIKYRLLKEFLMVNKKYLSTEEIDLLLKTLAKSINIKLEEGVTNNTTMVLGSNYLDSIDMVKNLITELNETSKALELGVYTNVEKN